MITRWFKSPLNPVHVISYMWMSHKNLRNLFRHLDNHPDFIDIRALDNENLKILIDLEKQRLKDVDNDL